MRAVRIAIGTALLFFQFKIIPKTSILRIIINPVFALDWAFAASDGGRKSLVTGNLMVNSRLKKAEKAKRYAAIMRGAPRFLCISRIAFKYARTIRIVLILPPSSDEFLICPFFFIEDHFISSPFFICTIVASNAAAVLSTSSIE